jgi:hypothetical protein
MIAHQRVCGAGVAKVSKKKRKKTKVSKKKGESKDESK